MVDKPKLDQMLFNLGRYTRVGDEHVYEYLQSSLDDLDRFGSAIAGHDWGE